MSFRNSSLLNTKNVMGAFIAAVVAFVFSVLSMVSAQDDVTIDDTPPASFPAEIVSDWKAQDGVNYDGAISSIKSELESGDFDEYANKISGSGEQGYLNACHWRRVARMYNYRRYLKKLICARHHDIGGTIIGYTEELNNDGFKGFGQWGSFGSMSKSTDYRGGNTAIMLLEFNNYYPEAKDLITGGSGVVRDPCPSYDGKTLVYAYSKDNNGYHIYDYNMETKETRQLSENPSGVSVSDFEPCVTPAGDIIFGSSRCFGHVDCNVNITSNLFIMNKDGKFLRRIGYDQVHTFYPTMMDNGSVMYTRWEYNDRNVANCFGIFTMNQDGSRQMEWYGNQTEWPATFNQARQIPGTQMALATIGGHQGPYAGDLVRVDISQTRNGTEGVELIAPKRSGGSGGMMNMDGVPDEDKLFQNPYPLSKNWFLISYRRARDAKFSVYLMNIDGDRELIAWDASKSVSQPISLAERPTPIMTNFQAKYEQDYGEVSVANVYYGMAVKGVNQGDIERIRVAAMEYRTDPAFGYTGSMSYQMTPVGRFGCSWEAKWIVGEQKIKSDGSAAFQVPANKPIFFQLIAENGTCVQTMRSWVTLMPGERFECLGCHEDKNIAPETKQTPMAVSDPGFVPLDAFYDLDGQPGSFYYPDVIQPILDKNCVKGECHDASHKSLPLIADKINTNDLNDDENNNAYRSWNTSYYNLFDQVNCNAIFGSARAISPRSVGSSRSAVIKKLQAGHNDVTLSKEEMDKLCAWIDLSAPHSGTYTDDMPNDVKTRYLERLKRRETEEAVEAANIEAFITAGGYKVPPYSDLVEPIRSVKQDAVQNKNIDFKVRFLAADRMLSMKLPSEGKIQLLDLKGRRIMKRDVSRDAFLAQSEQTMKLTIPAGTYIVKFDGVMVSSEEVVSVL